MSIFVNFLIFIHLIPAFFVFYIYYIIPYLELKKGASLNDYVNAVEFDGIPALTVCTLLPIFNWVILMSYFNPNIHTINIHIAVINSAINLYNPTINLNK